MRIALVTGMAVFLIASTQAFAQDYSDGAGNPTYQGSINQGMDEAHSDAPGPSAQQPGEGADNYNTRVNTFNAERNGDQDQ